jgi:hypothetical protein
MKNRRNTAVPMLMVAVMVVAAQTPVWGAVLIDNNFDGVADDIGPSFANRSWGDSSNANPNTGVLQLDDRNHYRVGLSTTSTVDASSAPGFTATWSVSSSNVTSAAVTEAGWFFGVSTATNGSNNLWDDSPGFSFGVLMSSAHFSDWVVVDHSDTSIETQHAMAGVIPSDASMQDGFTLSITLNSDDTWEVTTTGLSNTSTHTGSLSSNVTYSDLAGSLLATTHLQGGNLTYTVTRATLTTVPEPASLALIGLGGLMMIRRRRN